MTVIYRHWLHLKLSPHGPSSVNGFEMEQWLAENLPDDGMTSVNEMNRTLRFWKTLSECDQLKSHLVELRKKLNKQLYIIRMDCLE